MTQEVSDAKLGEFARRQNDWFRRVRDGSLDPDKVNQAVQAVIKGEFDSFAVSPPGLFVPAYQQLSCIKSRNIMLKWGFTEEHFEKLGEPPAWPSGPLSAVVLDVGLDTVEQTFEEAWALVVESQKDNNGGHWRWDGVTSDKDHLRLHDGIVHERGLSWKIIDLAANLDKKNGVKPQDVRNANSPHSAILWAASYFPKWIQAMDGENIQFVWIPGYELNTGGIAPWTYVPFLCGPRDGRGVVLSAGVAVHPPQHWAVPSLREC